jgi:hypothetical protein
MKKTAAAAAPAIAQSAHDRALLMMAQGSSRLDILTLLATAGERASGPGSVTSILVVDEDGLLRNGASPNLPSDYLDAIDRIKPHPDLGTCASAAATGEITITTDFKSDKKWSELRHLPMTLGFVGAWSMPVKGADGRVLGTFGTYFREQREPTDAEREAVRILACAAARVLQS